MAVRRVARTSCLLGVFYFGRAKAASLICVPAAGVHFAVFAMPADLFPEAPSPENFIQRAFHSSVLLGDHVFIDGGEITQKINGTTVKAITNVTLTIDMRNSWTNDSITFGIIPRIGPPTMNLEVLWPTADNNSFFVFGGETSFIAVPPIPPELQVWEFLRDGSNGSWTNFEPNGYSGFSNLTRPDGALGVTMGNTGYILGGFESQHSNPDITSTGDTSVPGMVAFNMTSGRWTNTTTPSNLVRRSGKNGILASVPSFGPSGLLLAVGTGSNLEGPLHFDNITLYEPINKTWHYQTASGSIPEGRDKACAVGIQGDNGTYEMLVSKHPCLNHSRKDALLQELTPVLFLDSCTEARAMILMH